MRESLNIAAKLQRKVTHLVRNNVTDIVLFFNQNNFYATAKITNVLIEKRDFTSINFHRETNE